MGPTSRDRPRVDSTRSQKRRTLSHEGHIASNGGNVDRHGDEGAAQRTALQTPCPGAREGQQLALLNINTITASVHVARTNAKAPTRKPMSSTAQCMNPYEMHDHPRRSCPLSSMFRAGLISLCARVAPKQANVVKRLLRNVLPQVVLATFPENPSGHVQGFWRPTPMTDKLEQWMLTMPNIGEPDPGRPTRNSLCTHLKNNTTRHHVPKPKPNYSITP